MVSRRPRSTRLLIGVVLLVLLVIGIRRGWLGPVESGFLRGIAPLSAGVRTAADALLRPFHSFLRVAKLSRAVRVLEEENGRLQSLVGRLQSIEEENDRLRRELGLLPRSSFTLVSADVVGRTTEDVASVLLINRGSREGLAVGMPVIVSEGIVVGRVREVQPFTASVGLVTDASFRASAKTLGTDAEGLVHGVRGIDIVLDTIPKTDTLASGDRVVTTGTDGVFPPHLLIGTIQDVTASENDIFQSARITPQVDGRRLRIVSVIVQKATHARPSDARGNPR